MTALGLKSKKPIFPAREISSQDLPHIYANTNKISENLPLSTRELNLLKCHVTSSSDEIATQRINILATPTVRAHVRNILRNLQVHDRTKAAGGTRDTSIRSVIQEGASLP